MGILVEHVIRRAALHNVCYIKRLPTKQFYTFVDLTKHEVHSIIFTNKAETARQEMEWLKKNVVFGL